jgi:phosphatidylglycerol:prolipoprotein diacylglycerol transferase
MFVAGIAGARLFYVIQYWPAMTRGDLFGTTAAILNFTEGGLVVYGSLIGAVVAFCAFVILARLPALQLADTIAPSLVLGLAIGRVGCLLNGCCFGGVCEDNPFCITFPRYSAPELYTLSPAYHHQLSDQLTGDYLHGIRLSASAGTLAVTAVKPGSDAEKADIKPGMQIRSIQGEAIVGRESIDTASYLLGTTSTPIDVVTETGEHFVWAADLLPDRSQPVHPTQIYSSINAFLIFAVAWGYFPFRRRAGEVFGLLLTVYPITRILLEWVRVDEAGVFGTPLTISQWVSLGILMAMLAYWPFVLRRPQLNTPPVAACSSS